MTDILVRIACLLYLVTNDRLAVNLSIRILKIQKKMTEVKQILTLVADLWLKLLAMFSKMMVVVCWHPTYSLCNHYGSLWLKTQLSSTPVLNSAISQNISRKLVLILAQSYLLNAITFGMIFYNLLDVLLQLAPTVYHIKTKQNSWRGFYLAPYLIKVVYALCLLHRWSSTSLETTLGWTM